MKRSSASLPEFDYKPGFRPTTPYISSYAQYDDLANRSFKSDSADPQEWALHILNEFCEDANAAVGGTVSDVFPKRQEEYSASATIYPRGYDDEPRVYPARTVDTLQGYQSSDHPRSFDRWGGCADEQYPATGYFRIQSIHDRSWLIDPDGHPFFSAGVSCVDVHTKACFRNKMEQVYGTRENWANAALSQLHSLGLNTAGAWSDETALKKANGSIAICAMSYFITTYGQINGLLEPGVGHMVFRNNNAMPVFDPSFETFACEYSAQIAQMHRDSPEIIGWFSDNELPSNANALERYLTLDPSDQRNWYSLSVAWEFLRQQTCLTNPSLNDVTDEISHRFRGIIYNRYFRVVRTALKKADPNHLYLGCRFSYLGSFFLEGTLLCQSIWEAAGRWCDAISVNYYMNWTPDASDVYNWYKWSGKPFLITEWYAMSRDSGLPCNTGAGFRVSSQADRAVFFQNFALWLLECPFCIGYHWFKYMDNDPSDSQMEASNKDSNKGIVAGDFTVWEPLGCSMKQLNMQLYDLIRFFDQRNKQPPSP